MEGSFAFGPHLVMDRTALEPKFITERSAVKLSTLRVVKR